jgi:hypothetical protein
MVNLNSVRKRVSMGVLDERFILSSYDNFQGLTYGDILIRWNNWLMGDDPDNRPVQDILFLRGNIGYHNDPYSFYGPRTITATEGTAILIPIVSTLYRIGDRYDGDLVTDEYGLRRAVFEHVNAAGPIWATIQDMDDPDQPARRIVKNLVEFRFQTPVFDLQISDKNPFLDKMDTRLSPGNYKSLAGGYFLLAVNLPPSNYRIRFGGRGFGNFYTDALYQVQLYRSQNPICKDISDINKPSFDKCMNSNSE